MINSSLSLKHTLIICSRDRVSSLLQTLESVSSQIMGTTPTKIIVVLNLKKSHDFTLLQSGLKELGLEQTEIIHTHKGTSSARNLGLRKITETDIVHFIDDDVYIGESYFIDVEKFFVSYPNATGGAPMSTVELQSHRHQRNKFLRNIFGLIAKPGKVTRSLRNYWGSSTEKTCFEVEWLPGLAMFYQFRDLEGKFFEERLEECPLGGYSLGEDLLYSLGLNLNGKKLFAVPTISVVHSELPNAARGSKISDFARGELRSHLLHKYPDHFTKSIYFGSLMLELGLTFFGSPKKFPVQIGQVLREIRGFHNKHQL